MTARLAVVSGTGTGVGKTHFSIALLRAAAAQGARALGLKPIETGIAQAVASDADRLEHASTFHVQLPGYYYADPLSPHLAARLAGETIAIEPLVGAIWTAIDDADLAVVELAGGLFTPLHERATNADLALALDPNHLILVTTDRLGVLHDILAATRAAKSMGLAIDSIVLMPPAQGDTSTGRNVPEILRFLPTTRAFSLPLGDPNETARAPDVVALVQALLSAPRGARGPIR
jgi:dethiobiotin synthetase